MKIRSQEHAKNKNKMRTKFTNLKSKQTQRDVMDRYEITQMNSGSQDLVIVLVSVIKILISF